MELGWFVFIVNLTGYGITLETTLQKHLWGTIYLD